MFSNDHPAIVANYVRMLHTSRNIPEAKRIYNARPPALWLENDRIELQNLLKNASPRGPHSVHLETVSSCTRNKVDRS